ncbi:MAG: energy transducer TonB, partial [Ignavibacteriae bacterium]|nr:energy transducer TonB [Ignavibacteriota bacterium]
KKSYLFSFAFHLILALILFIIKVNMEPVEDDFVTVGFGSIGNLSSAGVLAKTPTEEIQKKQPEQQIEEVKENVVKKVEVPKVVNPDETNDVVISENKKETKVETTPEKIQPIVTEEVEAGNGKEETGDGDGNFGFEIDFGGKGKRKIYSYSLPPYPDGVSKEIDVKLRFSILPDGSVGKILPLIKADTRLEQAAINSLRQWRFEPIPQNQKYIEQTAVIIFPFRLN